MIIYSKSFPGGQYRFEGPDDALYAKSDSGWIDSELFLTWLNKIFLKYAVAQRPIMLLIDGHKSHMTIDAIDFCRSNNIILFCLPPHTTHALQPLDVSVFKSLKDNFAKTVRALSFKKHNFVVTKREFAKVLKVPFERSFSITNIKAGFMKCGIYPLNPNAVSKQKMIPSALYGSSDESALPQSTSSSESSATPNSQSAPLPSMPNSQSAPLSSTPNSQSAPLPSTPNSRSTMQQSVSSIVPPQSTPNSQAVLAITPSPSIASPSPIASSSGVSSALSSPPLFSNSPVSFSPLTSPVFQSAQRPTNSSPIVNPLVSAGLIPEELSDILATPSRDAAVSKKRTKRITGARDLTSNEYRKMLEEDERKKQEAEREKQRKKEEREQKKREREQKKKEREAAKKKGGKGKAKGKLTSRKKNVVESDTSDTDEELVEETTATVVPETSDSEDSDRGYQRPRRSRNMPARFREDSDVSEDDDGVLCGICGCKEPSGVRDEVVFWVDCEKCDEWVHNKCAFGKNSASRKYVCKKCT